MVENDMRTCGYLWQTPFSKCWESSWVRCYIFIRSHWRIFLSNHWLLIKKIHLTELVMHHFIQSTAIGTTRGIFQFFYNTTHKTLLNAAVVWSTFFVFSIFQAETKNGKWHLDEYVWLENTEIPQHLAIINCGQCAVFRSKGNCIHSKKT